MKPEKCVNISLHFKTHFISETICIPLNLRSSKNKWTLWIKTKWNSCIINCARSWNVSDLVAFDALHFLTGQRVTFDNTHQSLDRCIQPLHIWSHGNQAQNGSRPTHILQVGGHRFGHERTDPWRCRGVKSTMRWMHKEDLILIIWLPSQGLPKYPTTAAPMVLAGPLRWPAALWISLTGVAFSWDDTASYGESEEHKEPFSFQKWKVPSCVNSFLFIQSAVVFFNQIKLLELFLKEILSYYLFISKQKDAVGEMLPL